MDAHRIYLVEDHPFMRGVLTEYLEAHDGLVVCGAAASAEQALDEIAAAAPDLVLIDVSLPRMSGIDLGHEVKGRWPDLPFVMVSGHGEAMYVERALCAGARGYLLKEDPEEVVVGVREVLGGAVFVSTSLRTALPGAGSSQVGV